MDPLLLLLLGMVVVIGGILWAKLPAFLALLAAAVVVAVLTPRERLEREALSQGATPAAAAARADEPLGATLARRFGSSASQLGLLIALASVVGACLHASGGAARIVRSLLDGLGERRAPLALGLSGFVLGIPMFFDTVFLLLIPLARELAGRSGRNYLLYVLAIAAGTTMTHSLVPPTPGPLFVANALKVDLSVMIVGGIVIGLLATTAGLLYALWANRRWPAASAVAHPEGGATGQGGDSTELPPLWLALLPLLLPVVLISAQAFVSGLAVKPPGHRLLAELGQPNVALGLAAAVALLTLMSRGRRQRADVRKTAQAALQDAGVILLVTAAGGVFGGVLQECGVGSRIRELAVAHQLAVLPLAFALTALVRIGQGSATVAMLTSVGILSGMVDSGNFGFHPVYVALAIGCGSKLIPWMNDSGFWVVCQTSGLSERDTLRGFSGMLTVEGLVGFGFVLLGAWLLPL
jgi:gluconate:H+ symporter, GntP family